MKFITKSVLAAGMMLAGSQLAYADGHAKCDIEKGRINILGNEFPAIQTVVEAAKECAKDGVTVESNLTTEHKNLQVASLKANPAEYTVAIVANSSLTPLLNEGLVRPLDDLIAKHGQSLKKNQLISIDGKVMAVAFMANAQHLMYRKDVLEKAGIAEAPASYEKVLEAAEAIKAKGLMEYPLTGTYKAGWNLGEEFINMYLGYGGNFFKAGSAELDINNENGIKALETMKALTGYMNPDFLTYASNEAAGEWEAGNVAMMNMWGSRAGPITDGEGSTEEVTSNTVMAAAPTVGGGSKPATTLWWDGFTIAKNISDEDAEASFKAMVHGVRPEILNDTTTGQAVWLLDGFTPGPLAKGVFDSATGGATAYPVVPFMAVLHTALGAEIVDFLQGKEDAQKALADVEAAYNTAAKEQGFLK